MKEYILFVLLFPIVTNFAFAQTERKEEKKQFIYILHLVPKYLDTKTWTDEDNRAVNEHFERLKKMVADGVVLLAGKTGNWDEKMFGIVIYLAASFEKAKEIADTDPAVKVGLMTVETFPFQIALIKESLK
jgi:uncharacterized protein